MALIQRLGLSDTSPREKISHCPRCKRSAPFGKLGFKFQGKSWDFLPRETLGNYCKFCAPEVLNEHLPKITYTEGTDEHVP